MRCHLGLSFKPVKILKWLGFIAFALFGFIGTYQKKALAYSIMETTSPDSQIVINGGSVDFDDPVGNKYVTTINNSPDVWYLSPSLFFSVGSVDGSILTINADYYIGIGTLDGYINYEYLELQRNTLVASNLRCGVGASFKTYDSTFRPEVTNFKVDLRNLSKEYAYHITFTYKQTINKFTDGNTNASCWFVREPSDGLFSQAISDNGSQTIKYAYQGKVDFSLASDPISSELNIVNNNLNIINNTQEQIRDSILDETVPDVANQFTDIEISNNSAISDLVTMPITIIRAVYNNIGGECQPYVLPFGLTGGNETITLPCIKPEKYLGTKLWNGIDMMICLFLIYEMAMLFISSFESITGLEDTFMSLYEPKHADTGYKPKHGGD